MPLDLATVLTSGVVSAVVGGGVGYLTATAKTGRDERGKQIAAARLAVRAATEPVLVQLLRYDKGIGESRPTGHIHVGDISWAVHVFRAAEGLGPTRRRVVGRRVRRLVGATAQELAELIPADADVYQSAMGLTIAQHQQISDAAPDQAGGTLADALMRSPGDKLIREVIVDVRRLAACSMRL